MAQPERGGRKAALDRAKEALRKGTDLISRRQQLIQFADWSEAGWAVVDEYIDDDLADNSEDEKRIEREERMAEWKLAKQRKAANQQTGGMKQRFPFGRQEEIPPLRVPVMHRQRCTSSLSICKEGEALIMLVDGCSSTLLKNALYNTLEAMELDVMCHINIFTLMSYAPWHKTQDKHCQ